MKANFLSKKSLTVEGDWRESYSTGRKLRVIYSEDLKLIFHIIGSVYSESENLTYVKIDGNDLAPGFTDIELAVVSNRSLPVHRDYPYRENYFWNVLQTSPYESCVFDTFMSEQDDMNVSVYPPRYDDFSKTFIFEERSQALEIQLYEGDNFRLGINLVVIAERESDLRFFFDIGHGEVEISPNTYYPQFYKRLKIIVRPKSEEILPIAIASLGVLYGISKKQQTYESITEPDAELDIQRKDLLISDIDYFLPEKVEGEEIEITTKAAEWYSLQHSPILSVEKISGDRLAVVKVKRGESDSDVIPMVSFGSNIEVLGVHDSSIDDSDYLTVEYDYPSDSYTIEDGNITWSEDNRPDEDSDYYIVYKYSFAVSGTNIEINSDKDEIQIENFLPGVAYVDYTYANYDVDSIVLMTPTYRVGRRQLEVYLDGKLLTLDDDYSEVGTLGAESNTIRMPKTPDGEKLTFIVYSSKSLFDAASPLYYFPRWFNNLADNFYQLADRVTKIELDHIHNPDSALGSGLPPQGVMLPDGVRIAPVVIVHNDDEVIPPKSAFVMKREVFNDNRREPLNYQPKFDSDKK